MMKTWMRLGLCSLLTIGASINTAGAAEPNPVIDPYYNGSKIMWYPSKIGMKVSKASHHRTCFSGTASDKAGYNTDLQITGRTWETSLGRKVTLQRKSGSRWLEVRSNWTDGHYRWCIPTRKGHYRAHTAGNYYPYNNTQIRARAADSATFRVH